ncbi:MAG: acyl carrier protein phosphodiesterase, partial [Campylobacterales bacterium]
PFEAGLAMHGRIDAFTDAHPHVAKSKARLQGKKYLKGVVVDLVYDHLLVKHWPEYSRVGIDDFLQIFYQEANDAVRDYPDEAQDFVRRVIDNDILNSYGTLEGLETAFLRIDRRLSARLLERESCSEYLPLVKEEIAGLEADFRQFFPELAAHFKTHCGALGGAHWLK